MWNYKIAMATALVIPISAKMASRFKTVTPEEVTELKEATENFNTRKSTINRLRDFKKWCDENSFEKKTGNWIKYSSAFTPPSLNKSMEPNLSPKTRVKLLPNFTRHHLITHTANFLHPDIKIQVLVSCLHTFLLEDRDNSCPNIEKAWMLQGEN